MDKGVRYSKLHDGYKAVRFDYISDRESPVGYGLTMPEAARNLIKEEDEQLFITEE